MSRLSPVSLSKDGRSKRYGDKKTTERHLVRVDDKVLTFWRYTKNSHTSSKNWYVRCFFDGKIRQVSTKTDDLKKSKQVGKKWYGLMLSRMDIGISSDRLHKDPHLFVEVGYSLLEEYKDSVERKTRNPSYYKDHLLNFRNYIEPFFKNDYIENVDTPRLVEWERWRRRRRIKSSELTSNRLKKEYTTIFSILKYGVELGFIQTLCMKPTTLSKQLTSTKRTPSRTTFTWKEYKKLLSVSRKRISESKKKFELQKKLKKQKGKKSFGGGWENIYKQRRYLHYFIILLSNTGVRPGELLRVKHKDIKIKKSRKQTNCHLEISVKGKKSDRTVISKYGGYFGYLSLIENICPDFDDDDLLFPYSPRNSMKELLEECGLRYSSNGDRRDSKSLRHFYIMTSIVNGISTDVLTVQCDVSPTIMRQHYSRHLEPVMFREELLKVSDIQV
tara:strand:+ start:351 stop:1682 length:1332 start_codon:yes stop_codon:yes gene_type:complete